MEVMEELKKRLKQAGVPLEHVYRHPQGAASLAVLQKIEVLFRAQDLGAKLLESMGRRAPLPRTKKIEYYRQCLARGNEQSFSILMLAESGAVYDASILNRTLVERALLVAHLTVEDKFDFFAEWTFIQGIKHKQKYVSYNGGKGVISKEERAKFDQLMKDEKLRKWKFNAEEAAKALGAKKLYDAIYDFASSHVHPRYGDGYHDLGYEDYKGEHDEWRLMQVDQATRSLALIAGTVAMRAGRKPHKILFQATEALTSALTGGDHEALGPIFRELVATPSEDLIEY